MTGGGEVKCVFERLRTEGRQIKLDRSRFLGTTGWNRTEWDLDQQLDCPRRRGWIRDHHLAAVKRMGQEIAGDKFIVLHTVFVTITIILLEKVLACQDCRVAAIEDCITNLLVEHNGGATGRQRHRVVRVVEVLFGTLEGQVKHGEGKHNLGEGLMGLRKVGRQK